MGKMVAKKTMMVVKATSSGVRLWSPDRPKRPDVDPMLGDVRQLLQRDNRSTWAKANVSGLAPSTIKNILDGKTRRPTATTYHMIAQMLGKKLKMVDD